MSKTQKKDTKKRYNIINLDDPNLVLEIKDKDFTSEFLNETKQIKKKAIKSTKNIVKQLLDEDEKIETKTINKNDHDTIKNLFEYEGKNVLMLVDKEGTPWSRAKDIALILEYGNTRDAIKRYVDDKYKKRYKDLTSSIPTSKISIDEKTIFTTRTGIFQLVTRSKKPRAIEFFEWIADEVIPQLLETGIFTIKIPKAELEKLTKDFYTDNDITDYEDKHVFYIAYIGEFNGKHILKFGVSGNYPRRELEEHRKTYQTYNVIKIWPTIANYQVEDKIKTEMKGKKVLVKETIKGKTKTELIALNGIFTLDKCIKTIDKIVNKTKSRYELENERTIEKLITDNENLLKQQEIFEQKIILLERENTKRNE